ncbi:unnamed protein product [Plutella xylostella]|uniref:(diamondback moth) hypothetical protein n=1 Tax=Plutella xylostella TaxID=51655 RepID=A0A8S4EBZ8_PLUXY|nr:unnamed protein product [Plutella xylostella]
MGGYSLFGCTEHSERKHDGTMDEISFHMFPTGEKTLRKWINATRPTNWEPKNHTKIVFGTF